MPERSGLLSSSARQEGGRYNHASDRAVHLLGQQEHTVSQTEDDFAAMFEASVQAKPVERGQTVEGTIVAIGPAVAFVDVGGKGEAVVDVAELKDADGVLEVRVGDRITAVVTSTSGGLTLSRRLARGSATDRQITSAYESGLPVEGKVEKTVKGGYEVKVGRQRGFCPFSQIDIARTADPEQHVGRTYTFRIIEYKDDGRNLVISRRALLEDAQRANAADLRKSIVAGAVLKGRVTSVRDFGAFIDLGAGIQGLLHVSEMGWSRVSDPSAIVTAGQEIAVKVLRIDEATEKIALGLKQLLDDPWATVAVTYTVGRVHSGRVTRVADFGAFVELEPGVEGLAHASTFPPTGRADGWKRHVTVGMTTDIEVLTVDPEKRRIGVAFVPAGSTHAATDAAPGLALEAGRRLTGKVDRHEPFGVFVFLGPGKTGVMPLRETGLAREADVRKAFPIGSDVEVVVLEADAAGRRIRVSRKAAIEAQDAEEVREYAARTVAAASDSFGSLADKLRDAIDPRRK